VAAVEVHLSKECSMELTDEVRSFVVLTPLCMVQMRKQINAHLSMDCDETSLIRSDYCSGNLQCNVSHLCN